MLCWTVSRCPRWYQGHRETLQQWQPEWETELGWLPSTGMAVWAWDSLLHHICLKLNMCACSTCTMFLIMLLQDFLKQALQATLTAAVAAYLHFQSCSFLGVSAIVSATAVVVIFSDFSIFSISTVRASFACLMLSALEKYLKETIIKNNK